MLDRQQCAHFRKAQKVIYHSALKFTKRRFFKTETQNHQFYDMKTMLSLSIWLLTAPPAIRINRNASMGPLLAPTLASMGPLLAPTGVSTKYLLLVLYYKQIKLTRYLQ